jgi:hypothetical protein
MMVMSGVAAGGEAAGVCANAGNIGDAAAMPADTRKRRRSIPILLKINFAIK